MKPYKKYLIKPLRWKAAWKSDVTNICRLEANTPFGNYWIKHYDDAWTWGYCFQEHYDEGNFDGKDLDDCKALAEKDWHRRLSKVLKPAPDEDGEVEVRNWNPPKSRGKKLPRRASR